MTQKSLVSVAIVLGLEIAALFSSPAQAGDTIYADDEVPVVTVDDDPPEVPLVCTTQALVVSRSGFVDEGRFTYAYVDANWFRFDRETAAAWIRVIETCRRGDTLVSNETLWQLITDPDPEVVAKVLRDRKEREIAPPSPLLSPVGPGVVNLGMWLAVDDPGVESVTASATSGSWVRVQAVVVETSFDMGNGDVVRCAGVGDPIPPSKLDDVEPSPVCGYTYRALNDGAPYVVTITSTWEVTFTSSRGTSGTLAPIVLSTTVPYEVLEIQTVGGSPSD